MKYENTPEEEIEATLFALEAERSDFWLGLRARVERTGGRDAQLNRLYEDSQKRMDDLLDKYGGQLAMRECFGFIPDENGDISFITLQTDFKITNFEEYTEWFKALVQVAYDNPGYMPIATFPPPPPVIEGEEDEQ